MSLSRLDLNLLVVLDTVLSERSVVRAARRLHVTPSAVSNALARLRAELGDALVVRSGRGVVPTPRAVELAPGLKRALAELERTVEKADFDRKTTTRQFTLTIADAGQLARLPRLVKLLATEMPRARLRVVGVDTYISSGGIAGTEVDVAIIRVVEQAPGVHATPLYPEEGVLVARRGNRRATGALTKEELSALQHVEVQVAPGRGYRDLARSYERLGIRREVALVVPNFIASAAAIARTDLVATLPTSLVEVVGEWLGLRVVTSPAPTMRYEIMLVWHDRTHDDPAMRAFRELVTTAFGETAARGTPARPPSAPRKRGAPAAG